MNAAAEILRRRVESLRTDNAFDQTAVVQARGTLAGCEVAIERRNATITEIEQAIAKLES